MTYPRTITIFAADPGVARWEQRVLTFSDSGMELDALKDAIGGGWLEQVTLYLARVSGDVGIAMFIDEEGKLKGMPYNDLATRAAFPNGGDEVVGTAILVGIDSEGRTVSYPGYDL